MKFQDLSKQFKNRETKTQERADLIAGEVFLKYLQEISIYNPNYQITGYPLEDFLNNYFMIKGSEEEKILNEIMQAYDFKYSRSIHNALYYLLGKEEELVGMDVNPLSWPGVYEIFKDGYNYTLETILGTLKVMEARPLFKGTKSASVFDKTLMGQCYDRTYDFLKLNPDYKAVLAYVPYFFGGGQYHAFLEKDEQVLDIAANALFNSHESSDKVLSGEIITKLSYKEVLEKFKHISKHMPEVKDKSKLQVLALYYDQK